MADTLSFQERSLTQQGYKYTKEELRKLEWGLRFTPLLCMAGAAYGLYMQSPHSFYDGGYRYFALLVSGLAPHGSVLQLCHHATH